MKRRRFLKAIGGLAALAATDPASALKALSKPAVAFRTVKASVAVSGNTLLTPAIIAREALELLEKNIIFQHLMEENKNGTVKCSPRVERRVR